MDKVELYRQVYSAFNKMCTEGKQPSSFNAYCKKHSVDQSQMSYVLRKEYQSVRSFSGYVRDGGTRIICSRILEDFKQLYAEGRQPGTFKSYYESFGISECQMRNYMYWHKLTVTGLPGYSCQSGGTYPRSQEIPFEDVIFKEAGFLPCDDENVVLVVL